MKLKKLFLISSIVFTIAIFCGITANAETEGIYTYSISNSEATITECNVMSGPNITIPSTLGGYPVTSIGASAFKYCSNIINITIPDSVKYIGTYAFAYCSGLKNITIPNGVTSLGVAVFAECYNLESITIPNSVTTIGGSAFYNCRNLASITIPDKVALIDYSAFYNCTSLEEVYISDIESWCNITFGGLEACPLYYGGTLYINNEKVENITIPNSITSINNYAFYNCTSLTSITIPNSVTSIGKYAFYGCSSITSITISENLTSISNYAFYGCKGLTEINWNAKNVGDLSSNNYVFAYAGQSGDGIAVTFGDSVESIPAYIFYPYTKSTGYSPKIISVTMGENIKNIGREAFYWCTRITDVYITNLKTWLEIDFLSMYSNPMCYDTNLYLNNDLITDLIIPEDVTDIKAYTFCGCNSLISVIIPDDVKSIGNNAFYNCNSLERISIPDSVTVIKSGAFYNCSSLDNIIIPNSTTSIEGSAFEGCSSITNITIPESVKSIGNYAFSECSSLTDVYYYGISDDWNNITIGTNNTPLTSANIVYGYNKCDILEILSPECDVETDIDGNITKIIVPNSIGSFTLDLKLYDGADWKMYRTNSYTNENTTKTINGLVAGSTLRTVYIRVTAADGNTTKDYAIAVYRKTKATDPVITINGSKVTITAVSGNIYYTTDGSEPTENSTLYTGTFTGLSDAVIKAVVIDSGKDEWSNIVTETVPTYITTTLEADYVTADSTSNTIYFGCIIRSDGEPTGTFIVAAYDDGEKLINCKTIDITAATDYVEDSFTYSGTPHTYKAFFWNSLEDLVPLCECIDGNVE